MRSRKRYCVIVFLGAGGPGGIKVQCRCPAGFVEDSGGCFVSGSSGQTRFTCGGECEHIETHNKTSGGWFFAGQRPGSVVEDVEWFEDVNPEVKVTP